MQSSGATVLKKWSENKQAIYASTVAEQAVERVMEALERAGRTGPRAEELAKSMAGLPVEMWGMLGFSFEKDGTLVAPRAVVKARRASLELCLDTGETTTQFEAAE
ncbi:MAG: hypothetical protein ACAH80_11525 [Alphaproteobacteria bacterium]